MVEKVWEGIWRYGNTYRVLDAEADPDGRPVWCKRRTPLSYIIQLIRELQI